MASTTNLFPKHQRASPLIAQALQVGRANGRCRRPQVPGRRVTVVPYGRDAASASSVGPVASGAGTDQEAVMPFILSLHPRLVAAGLGVLTATADIAVRATSRPGC